MTVDDVKAVIDLHVIPHLPYGDHLLHAEIVDLTSVGNSIMFQVECSHCESGSSMGFSARDFVERPGHYVERLRSMIRGMHEVMLESCEETRRVGVVSDVMTA